MENVDRRAGQQRRAHDNVPYQEVNRRGPTDRRQGQGDAWRDPDRTADVSPGADGPTGAGGDREPESAGKFGLAGEFDSLENEVTESDRPERGTDTRDEQP